MSAPEEIEIPPETNRLEKALPLLDELCGSRATPVEDNAASQAASASTVPPTGLPDSGDGSSAGCWVARVVYGPDNPRWRQFRSWLFNEAPVWFRNCYLRHGQRVARWIAPHKRVKSVIRLWMDSRIKHRA